METMNYYSLSRIDLADIEKLAKQEGYDVTWLEGHFPQKRLNIQLKEGIDWWQWRCVTLEEIWCDEEDDRERIRSLNPGTIFLFEYYRTTLQEIIQFMLVVFRHYGGWVDCKGDAKNVYSLQNITEITSNCP